MKLLSNLYLLWILLWLPSCSLQAQDRQATDKINREFTLSSPAAASTFALYNVMGSVTVQGYNGTTVVVEATRTVTADDAQQLAQGQKEVQLGFQQQGDSVVVYQQGPFDSRPHHHSDWHKNDHSYHYNFDFTVKVPRAMKVVVSTINGGEVRVDNVDGQLQAFNINGDVLIKQAREVTKAHTINGKVEVSVTAVPTAAASFHTINGDIVVSYPAATSANLHFKSMHGELYTDFPETAALPARVTQNQQREGNGTKYKLNKDTAIRLGKGGPDIRLETLNGDATIKQQL